VAVRLRAHMDPLGKLRGRWLEMKPYFDLEGIA